VTNDERDEDIELLKAALARVRKVEKGLWAENLRNNVKKQNNRRTSHTYHHLRRVLASLELTIILLGGDVTAEEEGNDD
jgi:hypothetical protein